MCYQDEKQKDWDRWENETTRILREILENPEHPDFKRVAEELEVLEDDGTLKEYWEETLDSYEPIYNYIHILETTNQDDALILDVALNTNCCVLYDNEEHKNYIALTGCGMDMNQDIGYAYLMLERWIPEDFISRISTQKGLTLSEENFKKLQRAIIEQTQTYENKFKQLKKEWK
jgi:hypothetical protein